jgi:hypothetical protein
MGDGADHSFIRTAAGVVTGRGIAAVLFFFMTAAGSSGGG